MALIWLLACGPKHLPEGRVLAYGLNEDDTGRPDCLWALEDSGPCATAGEPIELDADQAARLRGLLSSAETFGEGESKCFLPHQVYVFEDALGQVQEQVVVSLLCEGLRSAEGSTAQPRDPNQAGLSAQGLGGLKGLCVELRLPHCEPRPEDFR